MSLRPREPSPPAPRPRATAAAGPSATVAIETLSLHGLLLDPARAERVRAALAVELSALIAHHGPDALALRPATAPTIRIRETDTPEAIARAVARGLLRVPPAGRAVP